MAKDKIPDEVLERLKAEHPGVQLELLETDDAQVVIRPAPAAIYQKWMDEVADPEKRSRAQRNLVIACVVYPPEKDFLAMLAALPALVSTIINPLLEISGNKAVTDRKKL